MQLLRTKQAEEDLIGLWSWVALDSEYAADALLDRLETRMQLLASFPQAGPARSDIRPGMRMLVVEEYLVLYRILPEAVEIVRVVHGRRDLGQLEP